MSCPIYVRIKPLYTLRHHPAEFVTVDFFIADPSHVNHNFDDRLQSSGRDSHIFLIQLFNSIVSCKHFAMLLQSACMLHHAAHQHKSCSVAFKCCYFYFEPTIIYIKQSHYYFEHFTISVLTPSDLKILTRTLAPM